MNAIALLRDAVRREQCVMDAAQRAIGEHTARYLSNQQSHGRPGALVLLPDETHAAADAHHLQLRARGPGRPPGTAAPAAGPLVLKHLKERGMYKLDAMIVNYVFAVGVSERALSFQSSRDLTVSGLRYPTTRRRACA